MCRPVPMGHRASCVSGSNMLGMLHSTLEHSDCTVSDGLSRAARQIKNVGKIPTRRETNAHLLSLPTGIPLDDLCYRGSSNIGDRRSNAVR
eukprot:5243882-Prymnesium_polylepis.1